MKIHNHVNFPGFLGEDDLIKTYASADAFVFPSLLEGFGLPPLEAMSNGLPVIASPNGSLSEVLGIAARYIDPKSVKNIAEALSEIARDGALRAELITKGFEQVRQFNWQNTAQQTLRLYEASL